MRNSFAFSALVLLTLIFAACARTTDTGTGSGSDLSGTILADGSSTVFPITEAVAEEFQKEFPNVRVTAGVSGTGGGFQKFCNDETDLQNASRPVKDSETQACSANGIEFIELTVANDGLAVVVNKDNTWAECLTTDELKKIWEPDSQVGNWSQVRSGFPNRPLRLFGPGTDSGTFDYFTDVINGEEGASRTDYTPSEDDNVLVQGVQGDEGALGYFGFAYFNENRETLNDVAVDSGSGCVTPSDETVRSGDYAPLSRPLFLYVKKSAVAKPELNEFVDFYLANVSSLLADVGYTPLDDAALQVSVSKWETASGGMS